VSDPLAAARASALAVEANLAAAVDGYRTLPGAIAIPVPAVVAVATDLPLSFFNVVTGARLDAGEAATAIRQTLVPFRAKAVPCRWWVGPSSRPADLGAHLAAEGMSHRYDAPAMAADLADLDEAPLPPAVTIEPVRNAAAMQRWLAVFLAVFERPASDGRWWLAAYAALGFGPDAPWQHFVASLAGQPVATASLFSGGGAAGVYHVGTVATARGRGVGSAVTRAAMLAGRRRGDRLAVLQSSEMGLGVYQALGFAVCAQLAMYEWLPPRG
jgi:ribosomal protein S18 acetylase RimI-like enzyme